MTDDRISFLLATHGPLMNNFSSMALRGDKDIMQPILELNPYLFQFASKDLQEDFKRSVQVFASSADFVEDYMRRDSEFVKGLQSKVREKLRVHEIFVNTVLCGIMSQNQDYTLTKLNQGEATSLSYKTLLAEYVGAPMGRQLRLLRHASANISAVVDGIAG